MSDQTSFQPLEYFAELNSALRAMAFLDEKLDDTAVVLTATSLIDGFLKFALMVRFRPGEMSKRFVALIFEGNGPLATFSSKINLCVALGLMSENVKHDLRILKKIRNDFAHSALPLSLSDYPTESLRTQKEFERTDQCDRRYYFQRSCRAILGDIATGAVISLAEADVLASHQQEISNAALKMFDVVSEGDGPEFPKLIALRSETRRPRD